VELQLSCRNIHKYASGVNKTHKLNETLLSRVLGSHSGCLAAGWFLAWLIFYPEGGDDTFLRNFGSHTDYKALYSILLLLLLLFNGTANGI
jgi:hypothetical protein